ncbi:MAG: hypothetical protein U0V02_07240 [Anaerolineales bacterium]
MQYHQIHRNAHEEQKKYNPALCEVIECSLCTIVHLRTQAATEIFIGRKKAA